MWNTDVCQLPPIDWHARALAAETERDVLLGSLNRHQRTVLAVDAACAERDRLKAALSEALDIADAWVGNDGPAVRPYKLDRARIAELRKLVTK